MLIALQFPFSDARRFGTDQTLLIKRPTWPAALPDQEFVRCFGGVKSRGRRGLAFWGEDVVCDICRAIRFPELRPVRLSTGQKVPIEVAYRRMFCDGLAVGKIEIGLATVGRKSLNGAEVKELLRQVLQIPVCVPPSGQPGMKPLAESSRLLLSAYISATVRSGGAVMHSANGAKLLTVGEPMLFVEQRDGEMTSRLPFFAYPGPDLDEYELALDCFMVPFNGRNLRMWLMIGTRRHNRTVARALRLSLLRLHAEHQTIRFISRMLLEGRVDLERDSPGFNSLQYYLNEATKRVNRCEKTAGTISGADLVELSRMIADTVAPGERESVISLLESARARRNIVTKLQQYTQVTIGSQYVGDIYNVGSAGAVGPHSSASGVTINNFNTAWDQMKSETDLQKLALELASLQQALRDKASSADHFKALGEVAMAREAAEKQDGPRVMQHLKNAGAWVLEFAKDVGTSVAAKVIERSMGVG